MYVYIIFFIHSSVVNTCFYNLPVLNNAAVKIDVQVSLWYVHLESFRQTLRSGVAWLCDRHPFFHFLRNLHVDFHKGWTGGFHSLPPFLPFLALECV